MATIINIPNENLVTPDKVKDGQLAIIRKHTNSDHKDEILQRFGNIFIVIGKDYESSFSSLHTCNDGRILLEILPEGTTIQL